MNNKIFEDKEDAFIGTEFQTPKGGVLKVVGITGRNNYKKIYYCECSICSKDIEMFPNKSINTYKQNLIDGAIPCGCSVSPKWNSYQYSTLIKRISKELLFDAKIDTTKITGNSKICCTCNVCDYVWYPQVRHIVNSKSGCPSCANNIRLNESEVEDYIKKYLNDSNYEYIGFVDGYKNCYSKFKYVCKEHGEQTCSVTNFKKDNIVRCKQCALDILKNKSEELYGHYPNRDNENDNLYVIRFNNVVKVGRTFDLERRIRELKRLSKIKHVECLLVKSAKHGVVYSIEQALHKYLKDLNLWENVGWSTECFKLESLQHIYKFLEGINE